MCLDFSFQNSKVSDYLDLLEVSLIANNLLSFFDIVHCSY